MADDLNGITAASVNAVVSNTSTETQNVFDKDLPSEGCSPAPSNCSFISEQEVTEASFLHRQSPFLPLSQASPGAFSSLPRPDFLNTSIADSETSSRSSLDGSFLSKESSECTEKFRARRSIRKLSSSSSDSDGSELTVGGGSLDGDEPILRKLSKSKLTDSSLPVARRLDAPRGRIANIRRESDCSISNEVEHERLVKTSQQVSCGFDDITLESSSSMQCYSPSTHQMVRPNIPYSATPSPTQSPTRQRLLRSLSPITTKSALKRRYTGGVDEVESKRSCGGGGLANPFVRNSTSPLVTDRTFPYPPAVSQEFAQPSTVSVNWHPSTLCRRATNLENLLERRSSNDSVNDEQKIVDETDSSETQAEEMSSEEDVRQHSSTDDQDEMQKCTSCSTECRCVGQSSSEETEPERVYGCPYEPFLRAD
ncbi:hypothetical protein RB195_008220 [Necator americanus]|uniref:Uncharacterized protein n=1 Tax=Necator americanus TaxID=51031 RepID=A0ABR1CMK0_NECAM